MRRQVPAESAGESIERRLEDSRRQTLCAGLVLIVCSAPAFAATAKHNPRRPRRQARESDTPERSRQNNDGYISRSEADASPALSKQFATLDKNSDGKLSSQEYAKHK
jgi:hypothetical protein